VALDEQGNTDKAIEHYRKAAQLKPDDCLSRARLGIALCAQGATPEGLAHLSDAVNLDPANVAVRYRLATTLAGLKQHDQAIAHLLRVLRLDPRNTGAQIAQSLGNRRLADQIAKQVEVYRQRSPADRSGR
jgi:tetratricopeptide (TPR) repeat protein